MANGGWRIADSVWNFSLLLVGIGGNGVVNASFLWCSFRAKIKLTSPPHAGKWLFIAWKLEFVWFLLDRWCRYDFLL